MTRKIKEIKMDALRQALNILGNELDALNLYTVSGDRLEDRKNDKPLVWGVNWGAKGTCSIEETEAFAKNLIKATEICKIINSLELLDRTIEDDQEYTRDQFIEEVKKIKGLIEIGDVDFINMWLDKEVQ